MTKNIIGLVALIIIIAIMIYNALEDSNDKKLVLENYSVTIGKIIKYSEVSSSHHKLLTYSYLVNGREYQRKIAPDVSFTKCVGRIELCSKKHFFVIYSNIDNSKSLIDLKDEIQNIEKLDTKMTLKYSSQHFDTLWTLNQKALPDNIKIHKFE